MPIFRVSGGPKESSSSTSSSFWSPTELRKVPAFYPLERSSRLVKANLDTVVDRILEANRLLSVHAEYCNTTATATLLASENVEMHLSLWMPSDENKEGIIIEIQRRKGDAIIFLRYSRCILDAVAGDIDIRDHVEKNGNDIDAVFSRKVQRMQALETHQLSRNISDHVEKNSNDAGARLQRLLELEAFREAEAQYFSRNISNIQQRLQKLEAHQDSRTEKEKAIDVNAIAHRRSMKARGRTRNNTNSATIQDKKKATQAPRRPLSAYNLFSKKKDKEIRAEFAEKGEGQKLSVTELAKMVSRAWKQLPDDEKEPWHMLAKHMKKKMARYMKKSMSMQDQTDGESPKMQVYEAIVPPGVQPSEQFILMASNQRVLLTCPPNASAGQKILFQVPVRLVKPKGKINIRSSHEIKEEDGDTKKKFRILGNQGIRTFEGVPSLDFEKVAYLRKIQCSEENDARMRIGIPPPDPPNKIFYRHMSSRIERDRSGVGSIDEILASVHAILVGTESTVPSRNTFAAHAYIRDCWDALDEDRKGIFIYYEAYNRFEESRHAAENDWATPSIPETSRQPLATPRDSEASGPLPWARLVVSPYEVEEKGEQNSRWPMSEYQIFYWHMKSRIDQELSGVGTEEEVVTSIDALLFSTSRLSSYEDDENISPVKLEEKIMGMWKSLDANLLGIFVRYSRKDRDRFRNEVYERYTNKNIFKFHMASRIEQDLLSVGTKDEVAASIKKIIAGRKQFFPTSKTSSLERDIEHAWNTLDESIRSVVKIHGQIWRDCCITVAESKVAEDVALRMRAIVISSDYPNKSNEYRSWIDAEKRAAEAAKAAARMRESVDRTYRPTRSVFMTTEDSDEEEPD